MLNGDHTWPGTAFSFPGTNYDINASEKIWDGLLSKIVEQRGRLKIEPSDLEGSAVTSRFFTNFYIMLRSRSAQDWFNGLELDEGSTLSLSTNRHHIFPKAFLNKLGFSEKNENHKKYINEIANTALITASTNIQISDKSPSIYFENIKNNFPTALASQLIPTNPELWKGENFLEFLSARRKLIADEMNAFLEGYRTGITDEGGDTFDVYLPESETLEYKETWQYDVRQSELEKKPVKNQKLQLSCIKTVAAFLNTNGGNLFIGIEDLDDTNAVKGLERDLNFLETHLTD